MSNRSKAHRHAKKNYAHTKPYIHLNLEQRQGFAHENADCVANWDFARLFAECIDKVHFDPQCAQKSCDEQAFEQLISRFERHLQNTEAIGEGNFGLIVHDNNETVARKFTKLMRTYHRSVTLWINIKNIIETPMFVDSKLTSMVQISDPCCYSLWRYLENGETELFNKIYARADRIGSTTVGVRHFTDESCRCTICNEHRM